MELSGNKVRVNRPISNPKLRRPETEYSRHRKQYDSNPRYRYDNIVTTELDMPERTTQEFEGPGMVSRVDNILTANINDDVEEDVTFSVVETAPQNPYLHYTSDNGEAIIKLDDDGTTKGRSQSRPKSGKKSSSNSSSNGGGSGSGSGSTKESRPKSASRKRTN